MSSKIKIVIGVLLVVVLVVVAVVVLGGDDDDSPGTSQSREEGSNIDGDDGDAGSEPRLRTVAQKRSQGKYATANASGVIAEPKQIWLRVSAAPKQKVTGQWNVSCGAGATDSDTFTVTPPHLQKLRIPGKTADSCIAGVSAQLDKSGRLKVAILRGG